MKHNIEKYFPKYHTVWIIWDLEEAGRAYWFNNKKEANKFYQNDPDWNTKPFKMVRDY